MMEEHYLDQLRKQYNAFLSGLIKGEAFTPIKLRGGKNKPVTSVALHTAIASFLLYEKTPAIPGWVIKWEAWQSKLLGMQQWPVSVAVNSETDFLYLLKKEKEVSAFKEIINQLLTWNPAIAPWLAERPQKVLALKNEWKGICTVADYLLRHNVQGYYIRSLPVPVHTKFIQNNKIILLSLLKHLNSSRFPIDENCLEKVLQLQNKPVFHSMRWLDASLAEKYSSGMKVLAVYPASLCKVHWDVDEVWLVENETNLYLLPERKKALAIFSRGYALHLLKDMPIFKPAKLFYWGDLDEDGFIMLHQFRQYYPQVQSVFMDEATVRFHQKEMTKRPFRLKRTDLYLQPNESAAYTLLMELGGRIEQEQLQQEYMQAQLAKVS